MSTRRSKRLLPKEITEKDDEAPIRKKKTPPKTDVKKDVKSVKSSRDKIDVKIESVNKIGRSRNTRKVKSDYFESPVESEASDSEAEFVDSRRKRKAKTSNVQPKRKTLLELACSVNKADESECMKTQSELNESLVSNLTKNVRTYESESSSSSDESDDIGSNNETENQPVSSNVNDKTEEFSEDIKPAEFFDFAPLLSQVSENPEAKDDSENGKNKTRASPEKTSRRAKKPGQSKETKSKKGGMEVFELLAMGEKTDMSAEDIKESVSHVQKEYEIPKQVEVVLDSTMAKKKTKCDDLEMALRRRLNNIRRENQIYVHKVHALCWISHGIHLNKILNSPDLLATALSLLPNEKCYPPKHMNIEYLEDLINWFTKKIKLKKEPFDGVQLNLIISLQKQFQSLEAETKLDFCFMFLCVIRALGIKCRLVINLNVAALKPTTEQLLPVTQKKEDEQSSKSSCSKATKSCEKEDKTALKSSQNNRKSVSGKETKVGTKKVESNKKKPAEKEKTNKDIKTSRRSSRIMNNKSKYFGDNETDEDDETPKRRVSSQKSNSKKKKEVDDNVEEMSESDSDDSAKEFISPKKKKKIDRKVLSSEDEDPVVTAEPKNNKLPNNMNYWIEVHLEAEEKWTSVDICKKSYLCDEEIYKNISHPVRYILAWNNNQTIKDVTRRYVPQFLTVTRKLRVDDSWWLETLRPYKPTSTPQEREEDEELEKKLEEQPLPTSISEYKNHPLYALKRHLLKFQGIYPPDAPPLGFIKGEPVYSRLCVHQLHGREMWIKEAKVVKMNEKPYKIVKGRPKRDKFGSNEGPPDLELFGIWQVEDYEPPTAENGKVPRNAFGNVELFKPCMLPRGTVYLQIPGLQRVANKLNIDCAAAITGFDYSSNGWSYPVKDGFVVCEEYKDILLDAYNQEVEEAERKERQKNEERIYGNWKRLIRGLFIAEKLKRKYNFGDPGTSKQKEKKDSKKK